MASASPQVRELAFQVAGLVKLRESPEMKAAFAAAAEVAIDSGRSIDQRQAAVRLLSGAPYDVLAPTAETLLDARQPLDLQRAAVAAIRPADDPRAARPHQERGETAQTVL